MKEIKFEITNQTLEKYNKYYFSIHPRAKKVPIEHPYHPSINTWFILPRPQMNALKQKWKDFGIWLINNLGYADMKIENYEIEYITYMPTRRRIDPDNTTPKFLNDALVESGFIMDDDGVHMKSLTLKTGYDKENPRTEITVRILD